jgi:hypothetical protein
MALLARQSGVSTKVCSASAVKPAPVPRSVRCKSYVPMELIAAGTDSSQGLPRPLQGLEEGKLLHVAMSTHVCTAGSCW